jgi:hypothetical protein
MALRRIKLRLHRDYALQATRVTIGQSKLVYVLVVAANEVVQPCDWGLTP